MKKKKQTPDNLNTTETTPENVVTNDNLVEEMSGEELLMVQQDKFARLFAEFDNYKKRTARERLELITTANVDLLQSLIPIMDDFERAIAATNEQNVNEGLALVYNKFSSLLKSKGLTPMDAEAGDDFDVDLHEAITSIPTPDEQLKDKIVDVVEKGYRLGDKVVRFAKVVIGE